MSRASAPAAPQPFFVADGPPASGSRLLLITFLFPPAQAVGGLRWQKFAGFAAQYGWGLDVVTLDPADILHPDRSRLADLPAGTRVYGVRRRPTLIERFEQNLHRWRGRLRTGSGEPSSTTAGAEPRTVARTKSPASFGRAELRWELARPRGWRRVHQAWLEYHRDQAWAAEAGTVAIALAASGLHAAVITCGPPHMAHEAGRLTSLGTGLPFIMDLRDPWTLVQRLPAHIGSPLWLSLARKYERRAVARASLIVTNTEPSRCALRAAYPTVSAEFLTVMNGYDNEVIPPPRGGRRFTIAYAGSIYLDRDPRPLFKAAARVIQELRLSSEQFGIEFIGNGDSYGGVPVATLARGEGIGEYVRTGPYRPRTEALEFLAGATMLLSLPQDSDMAIPSKIFEYMRFEAWLLALAEPASATAQLLEGTEADVVASADLDGLARVLRARYLQFAAGIRPTPLARDPRFSREGQARLLFDAVARCAQSPRPSPPALHATSAD